MNIYRCLCCLLVAIPILVSCAEKPSSTVYQYDWVQGDGYRWAELPVIANGRDGFRAVPPSHSRVRFVNSLTRQQIIDNRNLLNGSGVAVADVTGNGFPDIYFCRLDGPNVLYENLGGFRFRDITDKAGVALPNQFSTGALFADLNANGLPDLVVTAIGSPNRVFINQGGGVFKELENALPADRTYGSASIAAADLNGNGHLDLYITNYKERSVRDIYPDRNTFRHIVGRDGNDFFVRPPFEEHYRLAFRDGTLIWFEMGEPDLLYFNDGSGRFKKADLTSGMLLDEDGNPITEPLHDWGLDVKIHDINQNGLPDIYVANDFETPDRIWLNQGDGTFRALPKLALRKNSLSSMSVDFSDIDRDGHIDIFVVEMLSRSHVLQHRQMSTMAPSALKIGVYDDRPMYLGNTLFLNRGDTTWAEISEFSGVRRSEWSWSTAFLDVTLNGYEDIIITNGHYFDVQDSDTFNSINTRLSRGELDWESHILEYPCLPNQNVAFRNNGDLTFSDVSSDWGFTGKDLSHGLAIADLNNNGYPDLVINRADEPALIMENLSSKQRIMVRLNGQAPNTHGIGARITVTGGPVRQDKEVTSGGAYLSGSDYAYVFATGDSESLEIEVRWSGGGISKITGAKPDRIYEISQPVGDYNYKPISAPAPSKPMFRDASELLGHKHTQEAFNDLERQPLLPYSISRGGPGITILDVNQDGRPDVVVPEGREVPVSVLLNSGSGFNESGYFINSPFNRFEATASTGWVDHNGRTHLITGISKYQPESSGAPSAVYTVIQDGRVVNRQVLPGHISTPGSLHLADYSGNGYPDLFIAGHVNPGRYPEPAASYFFLNDGNSFAPDTLNNRLFSSVGLVQGAVFSDITGNGSPELLIAERWGGIRAFENVDGRFNEISERLGLGNLKGWWNGIATGDLTGNGRMDIVATNWGENHLYMASPNRENFIFYDDLNFSGQHTVLEAYFSEEVGGIVPRRSFEKLTRNPPFVGRNVRTYMDYSNMALASILQTPLDELRVVSADHFSHTVFLQNDDGTFRAVPLPVKAQLSPAFGVIVADFTGDGNEDVFISQNYFAYIPETPRSDGGRGLLLRGDGTGNLTPVPGHESGILVYGEQRGVAAADMNNNGKLDLVVSQSGTSTKLFLNENAKPGLRVLLIGPAENPSAIGAKIRLAFSDGTHGPIREIQAGSGYRSQNGFVQVMGGLEDAVSVEAIWPDGKRSDVPLEPEVKEITIRN